MSRVEFISSRVGRGSFSIVLSRSSFIESRVEFISTIVERESWCRTRQRAQYFTLNLTPNLTVRGPRGILLGGGGVIVKRGLEARFHSSNRRDLIVVIWIVRSRSEERILVDGIFRIVRSRSEERFLVDGIFRIIWIVFSAVVVIVVSKSVLPVFIIVWVLGFSHGLRL